MFDPRIYRAALVPALAAFLLLMFSFEPAPDPLRAPVASPAFDGAEAARTARTITGLAPGREPGSAGDQRLAGFVRERLGSIAGGELSVQDFEAGVDGEDAQMQNVILTLPGASERTLLIVAHRDSAHGPAAAGSAAATATLLTLAAELGDTRHERTIVLASTDGGSDGALGASALPDVLPEPGRVDAAIAISNPAVAEPSPPFVVAAGGAASSPSAELLRTASAIAEAHFRRADPEPGGWTGLARLAFPAGIGEQAALREAGFEALAISAAGERGESDAQAPLSAATLQASGSTVLELIQTLDDAGRPPDAGPGDYVRAGENLIPGWTLRLLALALLIAPLLAAADTWLRGLRGHWRARRAIPWAAERILLPLAALLLTYLLALAGLIPSPPAPYDPALHEPGASAPVAYAALAVAVALVAALIRPARVPLDAEPHTLAAAAGLLTGGAVLLLWFVNPYLALLLTPAAHVWLLPARAAGPPRASLVAVAAALSLLPALLAFGAVGAQLGLGLDAPWHLLMMIAGGTVGFLTALLWCALLGGLVACVNAAGARTRDPSPGRPALRGAGTHAGPGALGGTDSALPPR